MEALLVPDRDLLVKFLCTLPLAMVLCRIFGCPGRNRTFGFTLRRRALCPLSYEAVFWRPRAESNRRVWRLQLHAFPLGDTAEFQKLTTMVSLVGILIPSPLITNHFPFTRWYVGPPITNAKSIPIIGRSRNRASRHCPLILKGVSLYKWSFDWDLHPDLRLGRTTCCC